MGFSLSHGQLDNWVGMRDGGRASRVWRGENVLSLSSRVAAGHRNPPEGLPVPWIPDPLRASKAGLPCASVLAACPYPSGSRESGLTRPPSRAAVRTGSSVIISSTTSAPSRRSTSRPSASHPDAIHSSTTGATLLIFHPSQSFDAHPTPRVASYHRRPPTHKSPPPSPRLPHTTQIPALPIPSDPAHAGSSQLRSSTIRIAPMTTCGHARKPPPSAPSPSSPPPLELPTDQPPGCSGQRRTGAAFPSPPLRSQPRPSCPIATCQTSNYSRCRGRVRLLASARGAAQKLVTAAPGEVRPRAASPAAVMGVAAAAMLMSAGVAAEC